MLDFIMILFQILTLILGIYILSNQNLGRKLLFFMLSLGIGIGFPLYMVLGTMGIFIVLILIMICLFIKTKDFFTSIILILSSGIIFVLGGYTAPLISRLFFLQLQEDFVMNEKFVISTVILGSLMSIFLYVLLRSIIKKWGFFNLFNKRYKTLIVTLGVLTLGAFYVNIFIENKLGMSAEISRANRFFFLIYASVSGAMYFILFRLESKNIQIENDKIQKEQLRKYTEKIELQYEEVRKIRHDYINILLTMTDYLNQKDIEGLTDFFSEKISPIEAELQDNNLQLSVLAKLKIPEIKGIVSNKIIKAQNLDIKTTIEITNPLKK